MFSSDSRHDEANDLDDAEATAILAAILASRSPNPKNGPPNAEESADPDMSERLEDSLFSPAIRRAASTAAMR